MAFPIIDNFTVASGLGINRDKTVILSSRDNSKKRFEATRLSIRGSGWPLVNFVNSHKYLGILFGRNIQVEDIYAAPALKAIERARRFGPALRLLDIHRRILTFNAFVTPIFSFVQQFYTMPSSTYREYRSVMHKAISPYNGTAWPYCQLCAPTSCIGFRQPLRDPWVHGASLILQRVDFGKISASSDLPWCLDGSFQMGERKTHNWDSPVFQDHTELQMMEFLGPGFLNWDGFTQLPTINKPFIKKILTDKLILSYSDINKDRYTTNLGKDHTSHIMSRHLKAGYVLPIVAPSHFEKLPRRVPPFLLTHYIKVLCGSLNSDGGRRRKFDPHASLHANKSISNPYPCYLCGVGSVSLPGDCITHTFTSCECVKDAWNIIINNSHGPRDLAWASIFVDRTLPLYIIDYPLADSGFGYNRLALVLTFCWAVHKAIGQIRNGRCAENANSRIVALTLSLNNIWMKSSK